MASARKNRQRVWITGIGTVNALGRSADDFWRRALASVSGMAGLAGYPPPGGGAALWGAPVPEEFTPAAATLGRGERFALAAAREALADAGLETVRGRDESRPCGGMFGDPRRAALALGVAASGMLENEAYWRAHHAETVNSLGGIDRVMGSPGAEMPLRDFSATAERLAGRLGIGGPVVTFSSSCSSSNLAIGYAAALLESETCDIALAGGTEALSALTVYGFASLRLVAAGGPCRPFDRRRNGIALGEGAGILVLERPESARRRGARPYAELAGYGARAEGLHMTAADASGERVAETLAAALADAGIGAESVDYINAHGNGTPQNDVAECRGIRRVFGSHADRLLVSSTKSMTGHTLAACGGIEAVATLRMMAAGVVLPTLHLEEPDPECDLDFVPGVPRSRRIDTAISANYAFGGTDCALVLSRLPESRRLSA